MMTGIFKRNKKPSALFGKGEGKGNQRDETKLRKGSERKDGMERRSERRGRGRGEEEKRAFE